MRAERSETWSPARLYLVISGVLLLVIGSVGFLYDNDFATSAEAVRNTEHGHLFGIFATNGWHNLAGLASGSLALGLAIRPEWARTGALIKGFMYVVVTSALAIWDGPTFWVALNTADQILHGSLAVTGLLCGFATPRRRRPSDLVQQTAT